MNWEQLEAGSVVQQLESDAAAGLSTDEAARRLERYGPNELNGSGGKGPLRIFWEQLTALMMVILICAAAISALLGDYGDSIAIGAIVLLNAVLGFSQEYRAEKAISSLKRLSTPVARVRRDGVVQDIPSTSLVPGDVLLLEEGSFVPADCRLLKSNILQTHEAMLTGESEPVLKHAGALEQPDLPLADRRNMAYQGTFVTSGNGEAMVTEIGMQTELGRIAALIRKAPQDSTPLQQRLDQVGRRLAALALLLCCVIFLAGVLRHEEMKLLFLTAVSIGVAAVPEGLPAIVTIALTLGAQRMLRRQALIRRLPAVETLGSVTVICSDKTGTLTENRMTATVLQTADERLEIESRERGSEPGEFRLLLAGAALCNNARLINGGATLSGDPTEIALLEAAARFGLSRAEFEQALPRISEVPFTPERKRMTTIHAVTGDAAPLLQQESLPGCVTFTKGATEGLLGLARFVWTGGRIEPVDENRLAGLREANERLAQNGMRVMGVAFRFLDEPPLEPDAAIENGLVFAGMIGIIDPPRVEAAAAVAKCRMAGIRPVMITGDHPLTAKYVASSVGIGDAPTVVTGPELDGLSQEELRRVTASTAVYARVSPEHKLRIVESLQQQGQIVAMTGDGVNDAPALKQASIGVAMGITGTDVAKDAADMVLLDDNFATIVAAVEEGRIIYDNIRKFIRYILATNLGEILVMLAAPILGMPLPLTPLQILWMNLVTDGLPALALSVEPAESGVMRRRPIDPAETLFSRGLGRHVVWVGGVMALLSVGMAFGYWRAGNPDWQTFLFTVLTLSQMAHVMGIRSENESLLQIGLLSNKRLLGAVMLTIVLQIALVYVPVLQGVFHTHALQPGALGLAFLGSSVVLLLVETEKRVSRRRRK
ncbi:MAG TPA: cation-translocating P-type ATPase [Bryobacteraceae bacterium]|nr:cation-translocating P-type ATPase [Bryobacteraceae bacterium]